MRPLILALILALGGCSAIIPHFEAKPNPSTIAGKPCPPLYRYSKEQQAEAARELDALPSGSVLPLFMDKYRLLRELCR